MENKCKFLKGAGRWEHFPVDAELLENSVVKAAREKSNFEVVTDNQFVSDFELRASDFQQVVEKRRIRPSAKARKPGRSEAYTPYAAATARRRATPDHGQSGQTQAAETPQHNLPDR